MFEQPGIGLLPSLRPSSVSHRKGTRFGHRSARDFSTPSYYYRDGTNKVILSCQGWKPKSKQVPERQHAQQVANQNAQNTKRAGPNGSALTGGQVGLRRGFLPCHAFPALWEGLHNSHGWHWGRLWKRGRLKREVRGQRMPALNLAIHRRMLQAIWDMI